MTKEIRTIFAGLLLMFTSSAFATTVTYILDQSNIFEDNVDYLSVMVSDDTAGQLDFWVELLPALSDIAGDNFGIQSFAFNRKDSVSLSGDDFSLPESWNAQFNKGMSKAGKFDVRVMGRGNNRQDPLHFSVLGLGIEDIVGRSIEESGAFFAVHVAGFNTPIGNCGNHDNGGDHGNNGDHGNDDLCGGDDPGSAFFYGGRLVETQPPSAIPLPASVWLLASGLLGLTGVARRWRS